MRFEAFVRAFLVHAHQKRIGRHIEREDCSEATGRGHGCGSPPWGDRTGLNYNTAPTPRRKSPSTYRCSTISFIISAIRLHRVQAFGQVLERFRTVWPLSV